MASVVKSLVVIPESLAGQPGRRPSSLGPLALWSQFLRRFVVINRQAAVSAVTPSPPKILGPMLECY